VSHFRPVSLLHGVLNIVS